MHSYSNSSPSPEHRSTLPRWGAVGAIGLLTFAVVTTEMLPVGLLTPISDTLDASAGQVSHMMSVPALAATICAPLAVLAAGKLDRRWILCGLLSLLIAANLACAVAPSLAWLLAARLVVGLCIGGVWAIAGGLAGKLVPEASQGLATSIIFGGVATASVVGVPLGVLLGELFGWRAVFACMALFSACVLALLLWTVPPLPVSRGTRLAQWYAQLGNPRVRTGLLLTLLLVVAHFAAYTFVRPILQTIGQFTVESIGVLLFAYGIAGIVGNFAAGVMASRHVRLTLALIAAGLTISLAAYGATAHPGSMALLVLLLWGTAYGGVSVSLMTWMSKAAPRSIESVTSMFVSMFNAAIALGAFIGGKIVDAHGLSAALLSSAVLVACAFLIVCLTREAPSSPAAIA